MDSIMRIRWETGYMEILLDGFFPTTLVKFRKLLKLIQLDWQNGDNLIADLKVYFLNQTVKCTENAETSGKEYWRLHTKVSSLKEMIKTNKKPVGIYLTKAEYEEAKSDLAEAQKNMKKALSSYKENTANAKKFKRLFDELAK